MMPISSTDILVSSLPSMMSDFHCNISDISYTLSGYMIGFAVSILISGTLSDLLGRRKILLVTTAIYLVSCILMFLCHNLHLLITLRFLQGCGGGGGFGRDSGALGGTAGTGGLGGGGAGSTNGFAGSSAPANTGGGGGGAGGYANKNGSGGSGLVIIRYAV